MILPLNIEAARVSSSSQSLVCNKPVGHCHNSVHPLRWCGHKLLWHPGHDTPSPISVSAIFCFEISFTVFAQLASSWFPPHRLPSSQRKRTPISSPWPWHWRAIIGPRLRDPWKGTEDSQRPASTLDEKRGSPRLHHPPTPVPLTQMNAICGMN